MVTCHSFFARLHKGALVYQRRTLLACHQNLRCNVCSQNKTTFKYGKFPMTEYHTGVPMERVHIDYLGPLPKTNKGNEHILMIVDQFTK